MVRRCCQRGRADWVRLGPGALIGHRQAIQRHESHRLAAGRAPPSGARRRRDRRRRGERSAGLWCSRRAIRTSSSGSPTSATGCDAGVLLRSAAQPSKPGTATALYVGLSGPDARTLHRVTLDAQGKETQAAEPLQVDGAPEPAGHAIAHHPGLNGWKHVRVQVRGDVTAPPVRPDARPQAPLRPAAIDSQPASSALWAARGCGHQRRSSDQGRHRHGSPAPGCGRRRRGDLADLPPHAADRSVLLRGHLGRRHQPRRRRWTRCLARTRISDRTSSAPSRSTGRRCTPSPTRPSAVSTPTTS